MAADSGGYPTDLWFEANGDLSAKQFRFVKMSTTKVIICNGATDTAIGILQNDPTDGQSAKVRVLGHTKVSSAAALSVGLFIGPDSSGQADSKIWGTDKTEYIHGQVTVASGAVNGLAEAVINCATPVMAQTSA